MKKQESKNPISTKRDSQLESLLHSEHDVTIEKLAVGGSGIGRIDYLDKKLVIFIPKSAPEDLLRVRITHVEKNFLNGEIVSILKASPFRREAPCPYFNHCGGCSWQHIDEKKQITQKELILTDLFKKFLPEQKYDLLPTVVSLNNFEYRNRIQLKQIGTKLGYFKPESHDLVDIQDCIIAEKPLRDWLKTNKSKIRPSEKLRKHELKINADGAVEFYPIGTASEGLSFSQVNRFVNTLLVNQVVDLAKSAQPRSLTEFYAGSGNFTFPLAAISKDLQVDAIELNPNLTQKAVETIKSQKLHKQIRFYTTKSELFPLRNTMSSDLIMLDPPRQGCEKSLLVKIAETKPKFLLYISCHPVSLVRDLQVLNQNGYHFEMRHLQIFDMFPQTDHFETLCLLELAH
jgi:23S rRNA (uracil1939-C5)-methyltransferase